jgi:hypothetical protein
MLTYRKYLYGIFHLLAFCRILIEFCTEWQYKNMLYNLNWGTVWLYIALSADKLL